MEVLRTFTSMVAVQNGEEGSLRKECEMWINVPSIYITILSFVIKKKREKRW